MEPARRSGYCLRMAASSRQAPWANPGETPEQRDERIEREAAFIAASHAAMDAGDGIDLDALLDEFDARDARIEAIEDETKGDARASALPRL